MKKIGEFRMVNLYRQDGETLYGIKEFLLDSVEDLAKLPTNLRSGSSALIIPNGDKEWIIFGGKSAENNPEEMANI